MILLDLVLNLTQKIAKHFFPLNLQRPESSDQWIMVQKSQDTWSLFTFWKKTEKCIVLLSLSIILKRRYNRFLKQKSSLMFLVEIRASVTFYLNLLPTTVVSFSDKFLHTIHCTTWKELATLWARPVLLLKSSLANIFSPYFSSDTLKYLQLN